MSTSQTDRSWGFQAAEAALREGEVIATGKPIVGNPTCVYAAPAAGTKLWLVASTWTGTASCVAATSVLGTQTAVPRYIIEVMQVDAIPGANCATDGDVSPDAACTSRESRYRVTSRSFATDRADVILQSNLAVP
jgi:type IV pilus assembly protein PilX